MRSPAAWRALFLAIASGIALAQSINNLGSSGGSGPRGGIGDLNHPVLYAQSFITDGIIQLDHLNVTARQLATGPAPRRNFVNTTTCNPQRTVVVDDSPAGARQEMLGFGHAWTDSTVEVFNSLEPALFDQVMRDLFGQEGNNMGFMRHTIGSSDMSGKQYSFDDNGSGFNEGEPDLDLENFALGPDGTAMVEMIAKMGDYKSDVFLFGSPWSYPGWMKQNGLFIAPNFLNGYNILNNSFDLRFVEQAVRYFEKYVDAYRAYGVEVNGITLSNEPLNYQGGYPCMYLDAADSADIIRAGLGASMLARNVQIIAYDHNTDQPGYPLRQSQRAGPGQIGATGWHCYASTANYSVIEDFHLTSPMTPQFLTECSSYLPNDFSVWIAQNFLASTQHGSSGGAFWVLATDPDYGPHAPWGGCAGCLGSIVVNSSTEYTKTHDYYMMGQFSRFIRRGGRNYVVKEGITGTNVNQQFLIISIKNPDGGWAVVFLNNIGSDQDVTLEFSTRPGQSWYGIIPNLAVVTWLIPSEEALRRNATGSALWPRFPAGNGTLDGPSSATGTGTGTGTGVFTCPAIMTAAMTSTSTSSTTPLLPVPNTTHMPGNPGIPPFDPASSCPAVTMREGTTITSEGWPPGPTGWTGRPTETRYPPGGDGGDEDVRLRRGR